MSTPVYTKERLIEIFNSFDLDNDGFITIEEIESFTFALVPDEIKDSKSGKEIIRSISEILVYIGDQDDDDQISLEEFLSQSDNIMAYFNDILNDAGVEPINT